MKIKFVKERDLDNPFSVSDIDFTVHAVSLPDMVENFELFLRACGFIFDGHLDIVEDEDDKTNREN